MSNAIGRASYVREIQKGILAKIHQRIANRRSDFAHKRSRELVNAYQVIVFEALAPMEMGCRRGTQRHMERRLIKVFSPVLRSDGAPGYTVTEIGRKAHQSLRL